MAYVVGDLTCLINGYGMSLNSNMKSITWLFPVTELAMKFFNEFLSHSKYWNATTLICNDLKDILYLINKSPDPTLSNSSSYIMQDMMVLFTTVFNLFVNKLSSCSLVHSGSSGSYWINIFMNAVLTHAVHTVSGSIYIANQQMLFEHLLKH